MAHILDEPDAAAPRAPLRAPRPINDSWLAWITENRLRGCTLESMVAGMVKSGVDVEDARQAIDAIPQHPMFALAQKFHERKAKLESLMGNLLRLQQLLPGHNEIERRGSITEAEFVNDYVAGNRPVVLTELARDWPALQRWTPQQFKERFGPVSVQVQSGRDREPNYETKMHDLRTEMTMGEFVDRVLSLGEGNDIYMTASNQALLRPGMDSLFADIGTLPPYVKPQALRGSSLLWFGPAGTRTPLHHDPLMILHTQIMGRKHWRFVSPLETPKLDNYLGVYSSIDLDNPDLARWPELATVKVLDVVLEPGETIFIPLGWWHQVRSLDVCISLSYTNLAVPNSFEWRHPEPHS